MGTMYMQSDLRTLETGLKDLKQCRLMRIEEFRDMYAAIEKHHRNLRLAHLTGQAPDLQLHAEQDTRFYNILINMMNEVKLLKSKDQKDSLLKVHTWFQANKHILHCGPKFGKEQIRKEADEISKKARGSQKRSKTPKTSGLLKTAEKKDTVEDKPVVTRLTSAEGMRNFFKSVTPSTQLNGAETPQDFLNLDLPTHSDKVNEFLTNRFFMAGEVSGLGRPSTLDTPSNRAYMNDLVPSERTVAMERCIASPNFMDVADMEFQRLPSSLGGDLPIEEELNAEETSNTETGAPFVTPRDHVISQSSQRYVESLTPRSNLNDDLEDDLDTGHSGHGDEESMMPEFRRKLSRGQTPSASLRGGLSVVSQEQSSNLSTYMPKKMIHPIASLVNPHAQLAAIEAQQAEQDYLMSRANSSMSVRASGGSRLQYSAMNNRPMSITRQSTNLSSRPNTSQSVHLSRPETAVSRTELVSSRADNLATWKNFNKDMAYGQDILSNLNFVGRSGTAMDVRYSAHEFGEMPEEESPFMLALFSQNDNSPPSAKVTPVNQGSTEIQEVYTQNSLEEFYQLTDGYYPPKLPKYHHPVINKPRRPATAGKTDHLEASSRATSAKTAPLGKDYLMKKDKEMKDEISTPRGQSDVRLHAVVNMIDSVSGEMGFYKEKLAPTPSPGFRQPSSHSVSRRPLSRPATASGRVAHTPVPRSESPSLVKGELLSLNTNTIVNEDMLLPSHDTDHKSARSLSSQTNRVSRAVDWRGQITPEQKKTLKWQRQKFGEHSFIKKIYPGKRPVGATHAGKRPKTAPLSFREKWKTEKPNENNTRVESQAATNTMTLVDQRTMDNIMMVQSIQQWNTGGGSMNSILLDEDFLRSFGSIRHTSGTTTTATPVPMEYVPIVSAPPKSLESRTQSRQTRKSDRSDSRFDEPTVEFFDQDDQFEISAPANKDPEETSVPKTELQALQTEDSTSQSGLPISHTDQLTSTDPETTPVPESLTRQDLTGESEGNVQETEGTEGLEKAIQTDISRINEPEAVHDDLNVQGTYIDETGRLIEVIPEERSDTCSVDASVTNTNQHIQHYTECLHDGKVLVEVIAVPSGGRPPTPPEKREDADTSLELTKSDSWFFSPSEDKNGPYIDLRKKSLNPYLYHKGEHWTKAIVKPENYCFHCLPDSMSTKVGRTAGRMPTRTQSASAQVLRMARKQSEYFKRAPPVRTPPSIPRPHHQSHQETTPRQGETYKAELEHHARKTKSPRHFMEHVVDLRRGVIQSAPSGSQHGDDNRLESSLQVCRLTTRSSLADEGLESAREVSQGQEEGKPFILDINHGGLDRETTESQQRLIITRGPLPSKQSIAHIGRPIAQVSTIHDPIEEASAAKLQFEAKAAVDIQRIFRGYVARNVYKKLLKEERERREDEQKAAIEIQRRYRGHLIRKKDIEKKSGLSPEKLQWAKEYKQILNENASERYRKMAEKSQINMQNFHKANNKISVIGPHVEIYQIYHPKQAGPTKQELISAAIKIQKHIRGFIIRKRFDKLHRKAVWHGSTFAKMVRDYKNILKKCQLRHGVDRPKTPFTIEEFNDYMEMRKRYESVFDKKSFGNELELVELDTYFRECDLYPSRSEIDEALDVVLHGQKLKRGLQKSEVLEMIFYIYVPKATGLPDTRQSTWMNPIIDGVEARKLIVGSGSKKGNNRSEFVEKAPLEVCAKLVIDSKRMRREMENKRKMAKEEQTDTEENPSKT